MNESWKRKHALLIAIAISAISAFMLLFLMICFGFFPTRTMEGSLIAGLTVPTVISLYLFPRLCQKALMTGSDKSIKEAARRRIAILCLTGFVVLYGMVCKKEFESIPVMVVIILHYTAVSLGEEFTYRKVILNLLNTRYKTWISVVVTAFMFSFVLHINEDLIANLLIRFPMGIVLGCIAIKTNSIAYTIVLHTIYNLIVLVL